MVRCSQWPVASVAHNLLVGNLYGILRVRLPRGKCHVYVNDMRVHVAATGLFTYPDVVVACEDRRYLEAQKDTLVTPVLIAEVLSDSTEAYDRGRKFEHYQTIDTLRQYVLVAQDRVHVDVYTRHDGGRWLLKSLPVAGRGRGNCRCSRCRRRLRSYTRISSKSSPAIAARSRSDAQKWRGRCFRRPRTTLRAVRRRSWRLPCGPVARSGSGGE